MSDNPEPIPFDEALKRMLEAPVPPKSPPAPKKPEPDKTEPPK